MALHPKLAQMLQAAQAAGKPAFHECTPVQAREVMAASAAALGSGPELHEVRDIEVSVRAGHIPARLYRSGPKQAGLIVYLHGGGWCVGSLVDFDALARMLCKESQCAVLLLDYRLAPEHPFPAGLEDAIDGIQWAWQNRATLAGGEVPLVVAGDSAGGNLAAVSVNRLAKQIPMAAQLLIYPVTDCDLNTESYQQFSDGYPLMREDMAWFFKHYAPEAQWGHAEISPLRAQDLTGLPPTHVVVADHDVLRDDGMRYAQALKDSGNEVQLRLYPGMTHGFIRMGNLIDVARTAITDMARATHESCLRAAK